MNYLQLKTLLLSVITELKFDQPLARNAVQAKGRFKEMVGLSKNASNRLVMREIQRVYVENGLKDEFLATMERMKATQYVW